MKAMASPSRRPSDCMVLSGEISPFSLNNEIRLFVLSAFYSPKTIKRYFEIFYNEAYLRTL